MRTVESGLLLACLCDELFEESEVTWGDPDSLRIRISCSNELRQFRSLSSNRPPVTKDDVLENYLLASAFEPSFCGNRCTSSGGYLGGFNALTRKR